MKTICIDFDGVIYPNFKYLGVGTLRGEPVPGAREGLAELATCFTVAVHSARCEDPEGRAAIAQWLKENELPYEVVEHKPRAAVYLDDRAVCFRGDWPEAVAEIGQFSQWQTQDKLRARIVRKRRRGSRRG